MLLRQIPHPAYETGNRGRLSAEEISGEVQGKAKNDSQSGYGCHRSKTR